MTLRTRRLSLFLTCAALAACEAEQEPPPLFNAKDLSLQCPTGQVGWDFSTGGNDTAIAEHDVSREIRVDNATLGTCDYREDFALECDDKAECTRVVKKPSSPACAGGALNLTYHCGEESPRFNLVIPGDASAQTVTLACGDPLTIISAIYAANAPSTANQANITRAVASACTGKRRCSLDDPYALNNYADPWPNQPKDTALRYYCGNDTSVREATVPSGQRLDLWCPPREAAAPRFEENLTIIGVECAADSPQAAAWCRGLDADRRATIAEWDRKVKESCEGKKSCKLATVPWVRPGQGQQYPRDYPTMFVNYWCSSPQAPEVKRLYHYDLYGKYFELYCGSPIKIVGATGTAPDLVGARAACDYKTRCTLPNLTYDGGVGAYSATFQYTCGQNELDVRDTRLFFQTPTNTSTGRKLAPFSAFDRALECTVPSTTLYGGIRPVAATTSSGGNAIIAVTSQCFGRGVCAVRSDMATRVEYRCGSSNERKVATGSPLVLTCTPDVRVTSLSCDYSSSIYPEDRQRCVDSTGTRLDVLTLDSVKQRCPPGNNGACGFFKWKTQPLTVKWRCGEDPREYEYTGLGEQDDDLPRQAKVSLTCLVPDKPYVEKACVPEVCRGKQRRDGKLACIPDSTKLETEFYAAPVLKEWLPGADGGTSQWGGANATTLKEDVPYQIFSYAHYKAEGAVQLPPTTSMAVWAYDEYTALPNSGVPSSKQTTFGFRCLLGESTFRAAEFPTGMPGYRKILSGGKGAVPPPTCYRQDIGDGRTAWADAARRVGLSEAQFRSKYGRRQSWVVTSFDPSGKHSVRKFNGVVGNAVNPIGFFYNSQNGWIDLLSYYLQTVDLRFKTAVSFVESNDLELDATAAVVRKSQLFIDVSQPELLPEFEVDLTWTQRGDSPARNPLSPKSLLSASSATPLHKRNLRATIELARLDAALTNNWVPVAATTFPSTNLGSGNAFSQTTRLGARFTPSLRERALAVKGTDVLQTTNGWMASFEEDKTTFRVRVCMDFDEKTHVLGDTNLDNQWVSAARDGVTYRLGFKRRCAETSPIVLERELFVYPVTPVSEQEKPGSAARSPRQGDGASNSTNDLGTQSNCADSGSTRQCTGQSRSNMTSGGQFSISVFENATNEKTDQTETTKLTTMDSKMSLFGFQVFDLAGGGREAQSAGAWSVTLNLTPNLDNIAKAIKRRRGGPVKTDAKPIKTAPKGGFERDGLAMVLSKSIPFTLGPFPFEMELSMSVGFGFGASVTLAGDRQSTSSMFMPKYPCLKTGTGRCLLAYDDVKSFDDASAECQYKGGRLAEVRTAGDLTELQGAIASVGGAAEVFWLGGQLAYQYADPRCDVTRDARCPGLSRTRYTWLTGNVPFANQRRTEPALIDPGALLGNHGLGSNLGNLVSKVPNEAGVLLKKDTGRLVTDTANQVHRFACEFDPAGSYVESSLGVEVKAEFTYGIGAAICTPSADIGFCLGISLNFINASIAIGAKHTTIAVFNNSNVKVSLLGMGEVTGTWGVSLLSGALAAELKLLFWSTSWEIASYKGLISLEGELFPTIETPYRKVTFP